MLKKLIATGSAAVIALTSLANGLVLGAPAVTDPELISAVSWAYDSGLTKYSDADMFMPFSNITREQEAKFVSEFAKSVLGMEADMDADCSFSDEGSIDYTLVDSVVEACQMGIMMGYQGNFMPKQVLTRGQLAIVHSRLLALIDPMSGEQDHFAALQDAGVMNVANLSAPATREASVLMKYRIAMGNEEDLCALDPNLPECVDNGNGTGNNNTGVVVKAGDLNVSLNPSSPAQMTSIPNNGVSRFATVDFTAGSDDISINTVSLKRQGLGSYSDFGNGGRLYFEIGGVRVSSRATVSSDDTLVVSFAPALVVAAGKTVSVDLMAELTGAPVGSENMFTSTAIDSSAATVNGSITTPTLRTANYSVRTLTFTSQNVITTYQGNEETVELGKFQIQNIGGNTIDANVKAITFRNVANGDSAASLGDLKLLRAGAVVSTKTIVSGRDVTFVLADVIKDGQTASYTIQGKVVDVQNASGDTYKFILRQTTDLNATEANTGFRTAVSITANTANDTNVAVNVYTVNGGELKFVRDVSLSLSQNVSPGALAIDLAKGSITAKQAILLEDVLLNVTAGSLTIHNAFKKVYLQIGASVFTWTPDASTPANNAVAEFDGSVTVNGTVPVRIYADVYTNATAPSGPYTFGSLSAASFTRKEYVSNQNNVSSSIGTIAGSAVSIVASTLSVTKFDNLGTQVYATNNAQGKTIYGVRLSNNQSNPIKVGSITLTPSNLLFNNGASISLMQGANVIATKNLNGATTFNGLNIVVNQNTPVDLTFVADFQSSITPPQSGTFGVSFNLGDVIDNVTSNNVTVNGTPATSATLNIIAGGTVIATANSASTDQGFMVPAMEKKVGSINVQAVNDDLEVRALYLKVTGTGAFATNAGNQISNFKIKDSNGNVVATESARDTMVNGNDIVKFTSFVAGTKVLVSTSKTFNVYATANSVNDAASAGEFAVSIATGYDDASYSDEWMGTRLYSVNAGTYVTASSVSTSNIGNTLNVVSSYPKVSKTADGNATDLITITVQNPGSTNLTIDAIQYYASAQEDADITVGAKIFNGATEVAAATLVADTNTTIALNNAITIAGGDSVTLLVKLDAPFSNTAVNPQSGNRIFQISNVRYAQTFANGSMSAFGFVSAGYTNTVGLPVAAVNY